MKTFGAVIVFVVFSQSVFAKDILKKIDLNTAKALPKLPILTKGCEGECCGILKSNKALSEIQLFEAPDESSKKIVVLKKGESFIHAEFFTKILKFGDVREDGKNLIALNYQSEGTSAVWDGVKVRETDSQDHYHDPKTESWIQIKTKSGAKGWTNLPAKDGQDLDYGWCV